MNRTRTAFLISLALLCAPAFAGLVDRHFPGKSEQDVADAFEQGLSEYLQARLSEQVKPRIRMEANRDELYLELTGVEETESTWQTLVRTGWYEDTAKFAWSPHGETYTYTTAEIPPPQIAGWFNPRHRLAQQIVSLAAWLASKDELDLANRKLAELAEVHENLRADIEAWLIEKHGWDAPEDGLTAVSHVDLRSGENVRMLLAGDALEDYQKQLEDLAEEMFDFIESRSGGTRGKPGYRRNSPKVRLVVLTRWLESYRESFAETKFAQKKRNQKKLDELEEAIKADIEFIETEKFKAERKGIDGDWAAAAEHYEMLYRTNPMNPDLVMETAGAWSKSAGISDGGRKCEDPKAAARAAKLYEELAETYPLVLTYRNHAGVNRLAAGDKRKARAHHEFVIEMTEGRSDLSENEKGNREFAQRQLEVIG